MGQNWGSPQLVQQNILNNKEFLEEEKNAQLNAQKCPHLRHVVEFQFYQETVHGEHQEKIRFKCLPDFTKLKSLEVLNNENQINQTHFEDIFNQLILGLYEMHKNKFIGRSITQECIAYAIDTKTLNYGAFGYFHPVDQLQFPPECQYKLINTYETDYWLVAKIMWQLYNRKKDLYQKSMNELGKDILNYNMTELRINESKEPKKLVQLINSMLPIYFGRRISIVKLLDQLSLEANQREEMKNFYSNYDFGTYFLNLMKNTFKRDAQKILVYDIDLENKICKQYRKEIFQILLTYIALQLAFYYPTQDNGIYPLLLSTLSKYLTISSKILKDKLFLKLKGYYDDREQYLKLEDQIQTSHNQTYKFEKYLTKEWNKDFSELKEYDDEEKIKIISFKLYQFRALASKPESIPQNLLLNLLCNLKVTDLKLKSLNENDNLEQQFLNYLKGIQQQK